MLAFGVVPISKGRGPLSGVVALPPHLPRQLQPQPAAGRVARPAAFGGRLHVGRFRPMLPQLAKPAAFDFQHGNNPVPHVACRNVRRRPLIPGTVRGCRPGADASIAVLRKSDVQVGPPHDGQLPRGHQCGRPGVGETRFRMQGGRQDGLPAPA